jgi:tryptophan synthase beta chain
MRARLLEEAIGTKSRIFIKREDILPTHSFKINSAIAQVYFANEEGFEGIISETGAGQWGLAVSFAAKLIGIKASFFWVRGSLRQKQYREIWCRLLDAQIIESPSDLTNTGRAYLTLNKESPGSLGISIGEAVEYALSHQGFAYLSGSNLPNVLMHQSVIGLELKQQLNGLGVKPDYFVACCGGGSNLVGFTGPFLFDPDYSCSQFIAAESDGAPRLTQGVYEYDFPDPLGFLPKVKSYTLGCKYMPPLNHVGGLRQHNGSPIVGYLRNQELIAARSYSQEEALIAGKLFASLYGTVPAPESSHALAETIRLAKEEPNKEKEIVMCLSGSGALDLLAYK